MPGKHWPYSMPQKNTNSHDHLEIISDSKITIDGLLKTLKHNEDTGWIGVENRELLKATVSYLRKRAGYTILTKVKGHSSIEGNKRADELAKTGAEMLDGPGMSTIPAKGYYTSGVRLATALQALLYRGILERKPTPTRRSTLINLDKARWAIKEINGDLPMDKNLWRSLKHKTITKETRAFLWKAMHNTFKTGEYWEKIPHYKIQSKCHVCDATEDMNHILTECEATGQETIWRLTRKLCERRDL